MPSGSKWEKPDGALTQFGAINRLLLSLTPMLIVVSFLGSTFAQLWQYRSSQGSLTSAIKTEVITLIAALVAIYISPTVLDFLTQAHGVSADKTLTVTSQFNTIIELLFGVMPIGIVMGIIGMATYRGYKAIRSMRGEGVMGM